MLALEKLFRVWILGIFFAGASAAMADPIALDWQSACVNSGPDIAAKGEPAFICIALGFGGGVTPIPYGAPVSYEARLTGMEHLELFPVSAGESDFALGAIAFQYLGRDGDGIAISAGSLDDHNAVPIPGTEFSGSVDAGAPPVTDLFIPVLGISVPIQGCEGIGLFTCTALFPIGGTEDPFGGAIFHDILFTMTTVDAGCDPSAGPCDPPIIEPIAMFFFRESLLIEAASIAPVGTAGDWVTISEPTTLGLLALSLAGLGIAGRRFPRPRALST